LRVRLSGDEQHGQRGKPRGQGQRRGEAREAGVHQRAVADAVGDASGAHDEEERHQAVGGEQQAGFERAGAQLDREQRHQHPAALEADERGRGKQQDERDGHASRDYSDAVLVTASLHRR
jgi:hypothetical protein